MTENDYLPQWVFYKGKSALLLRLVNYTKARTGGNTVGCVFITGASALPDATGKPVKGQKKYDWEKKIVMKLDGNDIGKIILGLTTGKDVALLHDPNMSTDKKGTEQKILNISRTDNKTGFFFNLSHKTGGEIQKIVVPILNEEAIVVKKLLETAITSITGWQ